MIEMLNSLSRFESKEFFNIQTHFDYQINEFYLFYFDNNLNFSFLN